MVRLHLSHPSQSSPPLIRLTLQLLLQEASVPSSQILSSNNNGHHRKQLDTPKMESSYRQLAFDSCDEDYESCDSVQVAIANNTGSESNIQVIPSPFRTLNSSSANYTIHEMTEDLLSLDGISGLTIEESIYARGGDDYDVIPQRLDNFKKVTDPQKSRITIGEDDTTKIISKAMITEHSMILRKVRQALLIEEDEYPNMDDFIKFFFGPLSKLTGLFLEQLEIDYLTFLKWLSTIFILQAYRMSYTLLSHGDGVIDRNILIVSKANSSFFTNPFTHSLHSFILITE